MQLIPCSYYDYRIVYNSNKSTSIFPCVRDENGNKVMYCVSPIHGRSFIVGRTKEGNYIISKGNGLSYTQYSFLHTKEFFDGTWGLLLRKDAERDFIMGKEIESLGIKTNSMHCVLELEKSQTLPNGNNINPSLLQYEVECPYRICDAAFMSKEQIWDEVKKWKLFNKCMYDKNYMIAAHILISNLRILHDSDILHNAIHEQNYTWALELLDFELACSPLHPYTKEDDQRVVKDLLPREIIQTYIIINYIAGVLGEKINHLEVENLFNEFSFDLKQYEIFNRLKI